MQFNLFNPTECREIIRIGEQYPLEDVTVIDGDEIRKDSVRVGQVRWLSPDEATWIADRCVWAFNEANYKYKRDNRFFEGLQFLKYNPGGWYDWHRDNSDGPTKGRTLTLSVTLQKAQEGGGLMIEDMPWVRERVGDAVVFPSEMRHKALSVARGVRYALIAWVRKDDKHLKKV